MKFTVEVTRKRIVVEVRQVTLDVEADDSILAKRLAEATAMCRDRAMAWSEPELSDERPSELSFKAVSARLVEPPSVVVGAHGLEATCAHCGQPQTGLPPSGPWRCRACEKVNPRGDDPS